MTTTATAADLKIVGYKDSHDVELVLEHFTLRMTFSKAIEFIEAVETVLFGLAYPPTVDAPGMYEEPDEGLMFR